MAQAKTRRSKKSPKSSSAKRPKSSSASTRSRSRSRKTKSSSRPRSTKQGSNASNQGSSAADRLRDVPQAVEKTGKKVGHNVGRAASNAKTPLLASGAALAGAAGGLAVGAMRSRRSPKGLVPKALRRRRTKVRSQDIARAARGIGTVSRHVADLTNEMDGERQSKNGKRKSPVEVVLEGLTARR